MDEKELEEIWGVLANAGEQLKIIKDILKVLIDTQGKLNQRLNKLEEEYENQRELFINKN